MALTATDEMRDALGRGPAAGIEVSEVDRVLTVAAQVVRAWVDPEGDSENLPPVEIETEAVIRTAGYLLDSPVGPIAAQRYADVETAYAGRVHPLRGSGAMALLRSYKKRGAGALA